MVLSLNFVMAAITLSFCRRAFHYLHHNWNFKEVFIEWVIENLAQVIFVADSALCHWCGFALLVLNKFVSFLGQSNVAATYSRAEGNYENCPVYQTLNKKNPGTPVYQSPVHQSKCQKGLMRNKMVMGHVREESRHEPLRRPWTRPELGPPLAWSYNPRIERRRGEWIDDAILERA